MRKAVDLRQQRKGIVNSAQMLRALALLYLAVSFAGLELTMFEILMSEILKLNEEILYLNAIASILVLLIARMHKQGKIGLLPERFSSSFAAKELAILAFKKCPQCADQLPVSTLVCDGCDYNFLAGSILRHKLLPSSEGGMSHERTHEPLAFSA